MISSFPAGLADRLIRRARVGLVQTVALAALLGVQATGSEAREAVPTPESAEERVERIRESLVDQAMQAPVRVSSTAWLDERGQFRHVTRLYSDLRARALAELVDDQSPRPESDASPRAALPGKGERPVSAAPRAGVGQGGQAAGAERVAQATGAGRVVRAAPAEEEESCARAPAGIRRLAAVHLATRPHDGSHGRSVLLQIGELARDWLIQAGTGHPALHLLDLDAVPGNSYDYRLANDGLFDSPYSVQIQVESSGFADRSLRPGDPVNMRRINLIMTLHERAGARTVFTRQYSATLPGVVPIVGQSALPNETHALIREFANHWWQGAEHALQCEPLRVLGVPDSASTLSIPVGTGAGVRVGDRWLLTDLARIPARMLEAGALAGLQVAEVVAVGRHRSTLRLESRSNPQARPGLSERGVQWFATPM